MEKICNDCGWTNKSNANNCELCGSSNLVDVDVWELQQISSDEAFINAMLELKEKDPIEYQLKLKQFQLQKEQERELKKQKAEQNKPHCPHCYSTNIAKISTTERAVSVIGLGIFSKKINKSFKCKDCGYTW